MAIISETVRCCWALRMEEHTGRAIEEQMRQLPFVYELTNCAGGEVDISSTSMKEIKKRSMLRTGLDDLVVRDDVVELLGPILLYPRQVFDSALA